MRRKSSLATLLAFLGMFMAPAVGWAETASVWAGEGEAKARLVSTVTGVGEGAGVTLGLHFRLEPGWKVYWRSPGDAGFPPRTDWAGSENLAATDTRWPVPERFSITGMETLGYHDEVLLPVEARLKEPGRPLVLNAEVEYLICKDICVPQNAKLSLVVPAGPATPSPEAALVGSFLARVPGEGVGTGLRIEGVAAMGERTLRVRVAATDPFGSPDVYVEGPGVLRFASPRVTLSADRREAVLDIDVDGIENLPAKRLVGAEVTLTLADGLGGAGAPRSLEARRAIAATESEPAASRDLGGSLLAMLGFALLGGMILNLMPCVLPVLSLKLLGVVKHGGGKGRIVRWSFLASAAGILSAFLALGGTLALLKASGASVGWGIQFQQPWFLASMVMLVTLFACNLWGFFEVRLPMWVSDLGEHASHVHGLGGHFVSGILATLLATPCSAPFLGTAVGFGLSRGAVEILAVFAALGVGLASPYFAVAMVPRMATWLPRPGAWMVTMRRVMGGALALTGAWLLGVLWIQAGAPTGIAVGLLAMAAGVALYLRHRAPERMGRIVVGSVAGLIVLALIVPSLLEGRNGAAARPAEDIWRPFDQAAISALVAKGKVVFVDVTAEWCLTCKVNKSLVLSQDSVRDRLRSDGVVAMVADWTRPDEEIGRYLKGFGRYGIPFNAVYGPGAPGGLALPELLTVEAVRQALDKAAVPSR